jgi:hypothetical protein
MVSSAQGLQIHESEEAAQKGQGEGDMDEDEDQTPGALGAAAIQPIGPAPEKPTFGAVVTKDIENGSEIRKKFGRDK